VVGGLQAGGGQRLAAGAGGALGEGEAGVPPAAFAYAGEGFELALGYMQGFEHGQHALLQFRGGDHVGPEFITYGVDIDFGVFH